MLKDFLLFLFLFSTLHQYYVHNSSAALWKQDDIRQAAKDIYIYIYILIAHCDLKNVYNNNKMNNVIKEFNFILNYNEKNERTTR